MATILFTWELGGGLGHIARQERLIELLCRQGHRVLFAVRDLSHVEEIFAGSSVACFQAPYKAGPPHPRISPPRTYAHILHNVGFAQKSELAGRVRAGSSTGVSPQDKS